MPPAANDSAAGGSGAFARHKSAQNAAPAARGPSMPWIGRFLIFVFVPSFTGLCGLGVSYLQSRQEPLKGEEPHAVDFDRDFVTPFLLSMALVIVLGFQTNGFSGCGEQRRGAFVWPKARRVQRVRRERVIVEDEDDGAKKEQ